MKQFSLRAIASTLIALAALAAALFLATHHPLAPWAMMTACIATFLICLRFDHAWLLLLPALLPIVDLAPWTGWLTFEEFDILVLGAAAGAWLRHGWAPGVSAPSRPSATLLVLAGLYLVSLGIAFARGIADAGGFAFGWFQGYDDPMNSLRLAKSFVLAALFAPLLGRTNSRLDDRGVAYLGWGMALGLATVSLAAIWERIAYPGLLNFSSDYRTTALFWEMHVGGAALDGFLVLTLPFATWLLLKSSHLRHLLPAALIFSLGTYASLTTFSRGVYLAIGVSFLVMASMALGRSAASPKTGLRTATTSLVAALAIAGLAFLTFRHGGYRALLAVLGCLTMFTLTMELIRSSSRRLRSAALAIAALMSLAAFALTWLFGKASYWAYAATFLVALAGWIASQHSNADIARIPALAGTFALPFAALLVADHWGGTPALVDAAIALAALVLAAIRGARTAQPVWPTHRRGQGVALAGAFALSVMVAIFGGGAYMGDRFSTSERDFEGRLQHWSAGLALLQTPGDWIFGKGPGRFPVSFYFGAPGNEFPGSYRLEREGDNNLLSLSGPRYQAGYGEVLRIGQRVSTPLPAGRYTIEFDARAAGKVQLQFGLCSKHLLYPEACTGKQTVLNGADGWQHRKLEFDSRGHSGGAWYAPQFVVFTLAVETMAGRADIDNLSLAGPDGRPLVANGDFRGDMAHWFFTSDRHHMPWHMKSMFLHILFEHGALGLALFLSLIAVALFRSLAGKRAHHPYAPALAASISGFAVVGLFDSLLDAPRVAFLFFLLLMLSIQGRKVGSGGTAPMPE
jgi:hypothetical protein